jgi:ABC-2 type transport system permease protein
MDLDMSTAVAEPNQEIATPRAAQTAPATWAAPSSVGRFFGNTWAITKKELSVYFSTPLAYILISAFILLMSIAFFFFLKAYAQRYQMQQIYAQMGQGNSDSMNFTDFIFTPLIGFGGTLMLFIMPFFTMRLIAEEKKQQTFQLLMTSPVRSWEIVLGKFFSAQLTVFVAVLLSVSYPILLNIYATEGGVEWQTAIVAYLGLFFYASAFLSIGLFVSSLTESQIVAAVVTFAISLVMILMSAFASQVTNLTAKAVLEYCAISTHLQKFTTGKLSVADVCYFVSIVGVSLFLTRTSVERSRW